MRAKYSGLESALRAEFDLAFESDTIRITVHARGGSGAVGDLTNPDYENLVQLLLERLTQCDATLHDVRLASKTVAHLPPSERRVHIPEFRVPLPLVSVPRLTELRYAIRRTVAAAHTTSTTAGHGNATKRIEIIASCPIPAAAVAEILEWGTASSTGDVGAVEDMADGQTFSEGARVLRAHLQRERNQTLVRRAKAAFVKQRGRLYCEACGFDFQAVFGALGTGYIEAHHEEPLAGREQEAETRIQDLRMVCANCHRMLHRRLGANALTVDALRTRLGS